MRSRCAATRTDSSAAPPESGWDRLGGRERKLSQADLVTVAGPARRRLVRAGDPWATCRDGVVTALVTGGSAVLVVGGDADQLDRIASSEHVAAP